MSPEQNENLQRSLSARKRPLIVNFWPVVNQEMLVRLWRMPSWKNKGVSSERHRSCFCFLSDVCFWTLSPAPVTWETAAKKMYFDVDCIAHNICLHVEWELSRSVAKLFAAPCCLAAVSVLSPTLSFSNIACEPKKKDPQNHKILLLTQYFL